MNESSSTLFRKARTEKDKTKAERMRKKASKLRREERAAIKVKNKRVATAKARLAKQAKKVADKVARKSRPAERIMEGLKDAVTFIATDGKEGGTVVNADIAETSDANITAARIDVAVRNARNEHHDDAVRGFMAVFSPSACDRVTPCVISPALLRSIVNVLDRAGYGGAQDAKYQWRMMPIVRSAS